MIIEESELIKRLSNAKKVLLIEPNYPSDYPPLGLAKIKSFLNSKGIESVFSRRMLPDPSFDLICVCTVFTYYAKYVFEVIKSRGIIHAETPILVGGVMASIIPDAFDKFSNLHVFKGYSKTLDGYKPDYSIVHKDTQWEDYSFIFTSRGCPNKCLSGSTKVNTIEGDIPIKNLVGRRIGVYTYSPDAKEVFITEGVHIRKTGFKRMVRVHFDDGTHIDCTPDHVFLTFKNGNQFVPMVESEVEAQFLCPGQSIRAMKITNHSLGYKVVEWGRRKRELQHRMVAEYKIGRKLLPSEIVHHKDEIKHHNLQDNLEVLSGMKEHFKNHPEISERMKLDNPQKYCTEESFVKMGDSNRGIKKSLQFRKLMSNRMLGKNNPNFKDGKSSGRSRIKDINHKVIRVEKIGFAPVYDMEVPKTNWFFANNVLVHNCAYCVVWKIEKDRWVNPNWKKMIDMSKPNLMISDNNLSSISLEHLKDICNFLVKNKKKVLFNSGFDCKYITPEIAHQLSRLQFVKRGMRMAFDRLEEDGIFQKSVKMIIDAGVPRSAFLVYVLFNFTDRPKDAYYRATECQKLGIRPYPQCYRPFTSMTLRNHFVGKYWTRRLCRAFRQYWSLNEIWGKISFPEYMKSKECMSKFKLTKEDTDAWETNGESVKDQIKNINKRKRRK